MKRFCIALILLFMVSSAEAQNTKLHDFAGNPDGKTPLNCGLVSDGTFLYGMTSYGGSVNCFTGSGCGTIYKVKYDVYKSDHLLIH